MGIPVPQGLTDEEIDACDRFSQAIWGKPLFDRQPSHNGRHGLLCEPCRLESVKQREKRTRPAPAQPWASNVVELRSRLREAA